jgi:hypothetical protein
LNLPVSIHRNEKIRPGGIICRENSKISTISFASQQTCRQLVPRSLKPRTPPTAGSTLPRPTSWPRPIGVPRWAKCSSLVRLASNSGLFSGIFPLLSSHLDGDNYYGWMEMPLHHAVRGESLPQNFEGDSRSQSMT